MLSVETFFFLGSALLACVWWACTKDDPGRRMPVKDGVEVVTDLMSSRMPKPRIIVITTYESEADIRRAVTARAKGYLVKAADSERVAEAVRAVAAGRTLFLTEITVKPVESVGASRTHET